MLHWLHHSPTALGLYRYLSATIASVSIIYALLGATRLVPARLRSLFGRKTR